MRLVWRLAQSMTAPQTPLTLDVSWQHTASETTGIRLVWGNFTSGISSSSTDLHTVCGLKRHAQMQTCRWSCIYRWMPFQHFKDPWARGVVDAKVLGKQNKSNKRSKTGKTKTTLPPSHFFVCPSAKHNILKQKGIFKNRQGIFSEEEGKDMFIHVGNSSTWVTRIRSSGIPWNLQPSSPWWEKFLSFEQFCDLIKSSQVNTFLYMTSEISIPFQQPRSPKWPWFTWGDPKQLSPTVLNTLLWSFICCESRPRW